ncbi:MAG: hypothetical protein ACI81R_003484, partial [Bradymonadia bacterium]
MREARGRPDLQRSTGERMTVLRPYSFNHRSQQSYVGRDHRVSLRY